MSDDTNQWKGVPLIVLVAGVLAGASETPVFDNTFWQYWGDGHAELAAYDLTVPRYGQLRRGTAVTIFVTETFSNESRVKVDRVPHLRTDEFPVMKLNLIQDFPTGIYDYNMMTSAFVALTPVNGRPAGTPTKISFSVQEWCGHAYQQLLFDRNRIRRISHSYFEGEADEEGDLKFPREGVGEDFLLLWARRLAGPTLAPGESKAVQMLRSVAVSRLRHIPLQWEPVTLSRSKSTKPLAVTAGSFEVEIMTADITGNRTWTFFVEANYPHRVIKWETSDGGLAEMLGCERLKYWKMNENGYESALSQLGLEPRGARMP